MTPVPTLKRISFAVPVLACCGAAVAFPVSGSYFDGPDCDNHGPLTFFDELGNNPVLFPIDELVDIQATFTDITVCPPTESGLPDALIIMTNTTGRDLENLFYVADPKTNITNVDGFAISATDASGIATQAFRIDQQGLHRALIAETILADGIFQAGETWEFVLQDYTNTDGIGPGAFGSLDFAGSSAADVLSSGSILVAVPAPGAAALAGLAGLAALRRRRTA